VGRRSAALRQRRVFSFGRAVGPLDRRPGNRRIRAPPVSPESATCVPPREADRSRLSLTTTAGRRCLTDTSRERSTMSAIERRANPVPREAVSRESKRRRPGGRCEDLAARLAQLNPGSCASDARSRNRRSHVLRCRRVAAASLYQSRVRVHRATVPQSAERVALGGTAFRPSPVRGPAQS
jgi:hypothetical protein